MHQAFAKVLLQKNALYMYAVFTRFFAARRADAMLARYMTWCPSVHLSVRHKLRCSVKTAALVITRSSTNFHNFKSGQRILAKGRGWFFTRDNVVTPISREHCSRLQQSRCRAVIKDWMITFAACRYWWLDSLCCIHRSGDCWWAGQSPKLPLPVGDLDPI